MIIRVTHNIPTVVQQFEVMSRITLPRELEDTSEQAGLVLENSIKKHIPGRRLVAGQKKASTGRLHATFGHARPELTTNPEFNSNEAVFRITKHGRRIRVVVGTLVNYAEPVNEGFVMAEMRRVFFSDQGIFRTVSPFFFMGYHFIEKGLAEATEVIKDMYLGGVERSFGLKRFRAVAQKRDVLGRFARK